MSDATYVANPERGCGTKKEGGFYAEGTTSPNGALSLWTWILGTCTEAGLNCFVSPPARKVVQGNLAASLVMGEFVSNDVPFERRIGSEKNYLGKQYATLKRQAAPVALFDHVGSKFYTPHEFMKEVRELGPSRRITPQVAEEIAKMTPIPVVFTHSDIPLFRDEAERDAVVELAAGLLSEYDQDQVRYLPTWMSPEWGLYSSCKDRGDDHYLRQILGLLSRLKRQPRLIDTSEAWAALAAVMGRANFQEQPFGATWITKITYVKRRDDPADIADKMAKKGIQTLILSDEELDAAGEGGE